MITRRSIIAGLLAVPAAANLRGRRRDIVVQPELAAAPTPSAPRDTVLQRELQEVVDLVNRAEVLAAGIRRRLESGVPLQPGKLGASNVGMGPLEDYGEPGKREGTGGDIMGLTIDTAEEIERDRDLISRYPWTDFKAQHGFERAVWM